MSAGRHQSVLYQEVLLSLQPRPGRYQAIDCTVNGGGHAAGLLERSAPDGRILGLDADAQALELARERLGPFGARVELAQGNFRDLASLAHEHGVVETDGVVFDLGLSSNQLEASGRGFSVRRPEEPLDMRFEASVGVTASDLLNTLPERDLEHMFRSYGEEPRARRVARMVVARRARAPFRQAGDLVAAVTQALGQARGRIHPATRAFQAVRIAVNDELAALEEGLGAAVNLLRPGGRVAVISFHSLEDRIVKWRFREWATATDEHAPLLQILTRRPITPAPDEQATNPRARSAKLRVAERLPTPPGAVASHSERMVRS